MIELRPYQVTAVERLRDGIRTGHRSQLLVAPTGAGKTAIATYIMDEARKKGTRVAFVVDRVNLVDQTSAVLDTEGIPHGVIQAGHWRRRLYEPIQVCSAQTLEKRGSFPDLSLLVVDEAHCVRKETAALITNMGNLKVLGLTATPFTKGLSKLYTNLVNVTTTDALTADGYLVPLKMYAAIAPNMEGAKVVAGEWSDKDIEKRGSAIIGDIVKEWQEKTTLHFGGPVKTICFSATVDHGAELCKQFNAAGYRFEQISYKDGSDDRRRELIAEFRKPDSKIVGLVSCEVFTKGFDCVVEGTPVLTDRGLVPIEQVLLTDKVWDGVEWVTHKGPIFKGIRDVITYDGLTATPDHLVYTAKGWLPLGEVAADGTGIARTGNGPQPIRLCTAAIEGSEGQVREPASFGILRLWRTRRLLSLCFDVARRALGVAASWRAKSWRRVGSGQQHRSLRARQPAVVISCAEQLAYAAPATESAFPSASAQSSAYQIQRQNAAQSLGQRANHRGNHRAVSSPVRQTQGRVWDLLACGPRHRFTAADRLIHNCPDAICGISARPYRKSFSSHIQQIGRVLRPAPGKEFGLWLCHSGTVIRFHDDMLDLFANGVSGLDDGKLDQKARKEPDEGTKDAIKCAACGYILPPSAHACPACGHERKRKQVEVASGSLVAVGASEAPTKHAFLASREDVWRQFVALGLERKGGDLEGARRFAQAQYRNCYGVFARRDIGNTVPLEPSPLVRKYVQSQIIRWAKSQQRRAA